MPFLRQNIDEKQNKTRNTKIILKALNILLIVKVHIKAHLY